MGFIQTAVKYFRPNKTLEYYRKNETGEQFFIYNYEGIHFRLFQNSKEKNNFFENGIEPKLDFGNEDILDRHLENRY